VKQSVDTIEVRTSGPGLFDFTRAAAAFVSKSGVGEGLLTCFIRHTSASLTIQENADPDVLKDLTDAFARLAPQSREYRHDAEGPDDMPSHIKSALSATTLSIPVKDGRMLLGTWQALYVFEHRDRGSSREVALHIMGE
jgi:secondary thiamine-phosphate synthase enzyme